MSDAKRRWIEYYLNFARQYRSSFDAFDQGQFQQIQRAWAAVAEIGAIGSDEERARLLMGYLNAMDSYLERQGSLADKPGMA